MKTILYTATKYLNALEDAGILISEHVGKEIKIILYDKRKFIKSFT